MKQTMIITIAATVLISGGAGFFGGVRYQQSLRGRSFPQARNGTLPDSGQFMMRQGNGARGAFRPVSGEVIKTDDTTITVQMSDGSTKLIIMGQNTTIHLTQQAQRSDVAVGTRVAVFGQENSDGSVTAQSVQITPVLPGTQQTPQVNN